VGFIGFGVGVGEGIPPVHWLVLAS
jgi:hypothetical protein